MTKDFVQIIFDEKMYNTQARYNAEYAMGVNSVLDQLRGAFPDITDEEIKLFMSSPNTLASQWEQQDREEYDRYVNTLPKSVQCSMSFKSDKGDTIADLHKQLPPKESYFFKVNTVEIHDGKAVFNEAKLREACTVFGSPEMLALWDKATTIAGELTKLDNKIKSLDVGMSALEDPRLLAVGLIVSGDKEYCTDIDRLRNLIARVEAKAKKG